MKLNLGCHHSRIEGFVNIDHTKYDEVDMVMDVRKLDFDDNSAEEIYASSVLGYISYPEVPVTLREWRRVLVPGGKLMISNPDIMRIVEYINKNGFDQWIADFIYSNNPLYPDIFRSAFDQSMMFNFLEGSGFVNIYKVEKFGLLEDDGSNCTARDYLENKTIPMCLNMIAEKP